jgi:GTP-binding protein HflX
VRQQEKAFLAALRLPTQRRVEVDESLDELSRLAESAGARVVGRLTQERKAPSASLYFGKGKVEEIKTLSRRERADLMISDDALSPIQERNLGGSLGLRVIDRTALILDIFAQRARTMEGKLQVELAQLSYMLPRLVGQWKHLERLGGGIGTRGPGETQLETDRRLARERIARLKRSLEAVERERETQRRRRRREFRAAIVGYTNAGKSTLFNALTRSDVFVEDLLFATLDSTTRQMVSPTRQVALVTDTVGFIRKLPHHLVASFHSTLAETVEADVLLHVVDAAAPDFRRQMGAVEDVLEKILDRPRPTALVFNKCDRLGESEAAAGLRVEFPGAFVVSALRDEGLDDLREYLWREAGDRAVPRAARAAS